MNTPEQSTPSAAGFEPTRWTLVLRARSDSPSARAALSELCEAYYRPVYMFLRGTGRNEDAARELSHAFFARLLAGHGLDDVDPKRGRFRSFLLGAVKHFLADEHDRAVAAKRGGGHSPIPIEAAGATETTSFGLQLPDPASPPSDAAFDRDWAETVVARALGFLAAEVAKAGDSHEFDTLKPWLLGEVESLSQAEAAHRLGMSEGAVKVAIHRLRKKFRDLVKAEIAHTVSTTSEVQQELRYLVEVLAA